MSSRPVVVKVGGSLFGLPDLGPRLRRFLATLESQAVFIVPGGGPTADAVRELDHLHSLGEETSHWLALGALTLNAHFLASLLAPARVIRNPSDCVRHAATGCRAILDGYRFARRDQSNHPEDALPHRWSATSDSLAARAAIVLGARRLYLLKSLTIPPGTNWPTAARMGWVDEIFPKIVESAESTFDVHWTVISQ